MIKMIKKMMMIMMLKMMMIEVLVQGDLVQNVKKVLPLNQLSQVTMI